MTKPANQTDLQKGAAASFGVLGSLLGFRMRRIQAHLTRTFVARLGDSALKPGGFSAMALIVANPGLSQQMLSVELGQDKATVVQLLDELEGRGWAERRREAGDRRRHHLHVTPAGHIALERMANAATTNEGVALAALTPQEIETLMRLLDKVYQRCFSTTP